MRADAARNVDAIVEAALELLSQRPDASMADIARAAGVVRATLYGHFPSRDLLVNAAVERAIADAMADVAGARPNDGPAAAALERLIAASARTLRRYAALQQLTGGLHAPGMRERHGPISDAVRDLVARGQREGDFRKDLPAAWMVAVLLELLHAAQSEVDAGRLDADDAQRVLTETVLGALGAR
jgi:AcrR family transcriptional regulator